MRLNIYQSLINLLLPERLIFIIAFFLRYHERATLYAFLLYKNLVETKTFSHS